MKLRKISSSMFFDPEKIVTNPDIFSRKIEKVEGEDFVEERKVFSEDGLFSKKIFGDLNTESEYSCECGKFTGKAFATLVCDTCDKAVELTEANIDKIGWIDLKDVYIIKYITYMLLEKVIGRENLKNVIKTPNTININGDIDTIEVDNARKSSPEHKYYYVGISGLKENYAEILNYYHELHDKKEEAIFKFLEDPEDVFTNKIPVISTVLRPAMRTEDGLKLDSINNIYVAIIKSVQTLNDKVDLIQIIKNLTIEQLQAQYFQLSVEIMENIKSKGGLIRNQVMGTRINFSARNIISPAKAGYKIDEVVLPYLTFLYLYKFEIMNIFAKIKNIKFIEAEKIWYKATLKVDEEALAIMKKIIADQEIGILLNRNPTISYGSILYLRIAGIKDDIEDLTMSIHNGILSLLSGDYDGDVLNIVSLKDVEMKHIFKEVFSPVSLMIDSNNGLFNESLNLERDQVLGLNNLLI
jgi:DNA-directed RNA polymerase beta' subunit